MPVEVKICGLSTPETLDAAIAAGADYIGLVFFPKSPRNVTFAEAKALAERARGRAKIVALTVDAPDALLQQISEAAHPDYIQAHGNETPDRVRAMQHLTGRPVIKAFKVAAPEDVAKASAYAKVAAFPLFDAKAPETLANALPGGNGLSFDWSLVEGMGNPFMLSGGLNPDNVAKAISLTGAPMVDVSSGVESAPGVKDIGLIRAFIAAAKSAPAPS